MKTKKRVSQLTLELYHRGLATRKERRQVEKALLADVSVKERYEALKEQEREINRLVTEEMRRQNIQEHPSLQVIHSSNIVWGIGAAAAVLICALVPVFLHLRNNSQNKNNAVAEKSIESPTEETADEPITIEEPKISEKTPVDNKTPTPEQPSVKEPPKKAVIAETPNPKPAKPATDNEFKPNSGKTEIAAVPEPVKVIRFRSQNDAANSPEEDSDIAIPPGITFIFENMFANKYLVGTVIPDRIRSIAKNAYKGNPIIYVTIGADVDVHDEAIPGNFAKAYNSYGKAAGSYSRPDSDSEEWKKK
jgi:hypothetical protein